VNWSFYVFTLDLASQIGIQYTKQLEYNWTTIKTDKNSRDYKYSNHTGIQHAVTFSARQKYSKTYKTQLTMTSK